MTNPKTPYDGWKFVPVTTQGLIQISLLDADQPPKGKRLSVADYTMGQTK